MIYESTLPEFTSDFDVCTEVQTSNRLVGGLLYMLDSYTHGIFCADSIS
ncbi:hypothetical protein J2Y37_002357 [Prolinoborus sp. 3657]|nr:hypothetical protein [Prolinoborus sp. 3657]